MTSAVFTDAQQHDFDALASTVWALLSAEAQGNRALAASAVPVFCASWNAWGSTVRMAYSDAPVSLSLDGGGWSHTHDDAMKTTMAVLVQTTHGLSAVQVDNLLGILDGMPSGMPFQAYRGVWFDTQFVAAFPTPGVYDFVDGQFAQGGAASLSQMSDQISQGIDPRPVPTVPNLAPNPPAQTSVPSTAQATAFVMPHSTVLPEMDITGRAPAAQSAFPIVPVLAIGSVIAIGLGFVAHYAFAGKH